MRDRYSARSAVLIRHGFATSGMLFLAACASMVQDSGPQEMISLAPGLSFRLPESPGLGRRIEAAQLVTIRHGDRVFVFEGRVSLTADRFRMVGLDPLGRRALTVDWTGKDIAFEAAPWLPEELRARNLLADLVLIYWPTPMINKILAGSGAELDSRPSHRVISKDGEKVARIDYTPSRDRVWNGYARYQNFVRDYVIEIRSTELSP